MRDLNAFKWFEDKHTLALGAINPGLTVRLDLEKLIRATQGRPADYLRYLLNRLFEA
jgi:hypothetical protein